MNKVYLEKNDSINKAISSSKDGDEIFVPFNIYHEEINFNKKITLIGEDLNNPPIIKSTEGKLINFSSWGGIVRNCIFYSEFGGEYAISHQAIIPKRVKFLEGDCVFEGCKFFGNKISSLYVFGKKTKPIFRDCIFEGINSSVYIENFSTPHFLNCTFSAWGSEQIFLFSGADPVVSGCIFKYGQTGVRLESYSNGKFSDCIIENSNWGITFKLSRAKFSNLIIRNCDKGIVNYEGLGEIDCKIFNCRVAVYDFFQSL